jgi:hypothetical protein
MSNQPPPVPTNSDLDIIMRIFRVRKIAFTSENHFEAEVEALGRAPRSLEITQLYVGGAVMRFIAADGRLFDVVPEEGEWAE